MTWRDARAHQSLPPAVRDLLGEALAASALLAGSLKFTGTLTLQLQGGKGRVSLLIAQATNTLALRGVAHFDEKRQIEGDDFNALVGGGQLVITVEQGGGAQPWQGIVPLAGDSLATSLERYFEVSEQLPTRVILAANDQQAAGLMLQKLPAPTGTGEAGEAQLHDVWEETAALLSTLGGEELMAVAPQLLLERLFAAHDVRLFESHPVRFACRCSRERVASMLQGLGKTEVDSIIAEQGAVTVTCEFCQKPYRFDAVDASLLFSEGAPPTAPRHSTDDGFSRRLSQAVPPSTRICRSICFWRRST